MSDEKTIDDTVTDNEQPIDTFVSIAPPAPVEVISLEEPSISKSEIEKSPELKRTFLDDYEIVKHVKTGGQASVYQVREKSSGKLLAAKNYIFHLDDLSRSETEERALKNVDHPNIAKLYGSVLEVDEKKQRRELYLLTEWIEGTTLADLLEQGTRFDVEELKYIRTEIKKGLDAAHEKGIVHRDIKPSNIKYVKEEGKKFGKITLIDFGLAKFLGERTATASLDNHMGTPFYMSPEQAGMVGNITPATDYYGLGMTLAACAAGQEPARGNYLWDWDSKKFIDQKLSHLPEGFRKSLHELIDENSEVRIRGFDESLEKKINEGETKKSKIIGLFTSTGPFVGAFFGGFTSVVLWHHYLDAEAFYHNVNWFVHPNNFLTYLGIIPAAWIVVGYYGQKLLTSGKTKSKSDAAETTDKEQIPAQTKPIKPSLFERFRHWYAHTDLFPNNVPPFSREMNTKPAEYWQRVKKSKDAQVIMNYYGIDYPETKEEERSLKNRNPQSIGDYAMGLNSLEDKLLISGDYLKFETEIPEKKIVIPMYGIKNTIQKHKKYFNKPEKK